MNILPSMAAKSYNPVDRLSWSTYAFQVANLLNCASSPIYLPNFALFYVLFLLPFIGVWGWSHRGKPTLPTTTLQTTQSYVAGFWPQTTRIG